MKKRCCVYVHEYSIFFLLRNESLLDFFIIFLFMSAAKPQFDAYAFSADCCEFYLSTHFQAD